MSDTPTTPPGGSSTVYGILYQMLWGLLRALELHISDVENDDSGQLVRAVFRLEPSDGGDLQELRDTGRRVVVQLKTRSGGRTWSLRDIIVDVFPDLYRSVDLSQDDTWYDFITDAEMGQWQAVYAFFESLRQRKVTGNVLDILDDNTELIFRRGIAQHASDANPDSAAAFWKSECYTERSLFRAIVQHLRQFPSLVPENELDEQTYQKVFHLLSRFAFSGHRTFERIQVKIDSHLMLMVDRSQDVSTIREAMLTSLANAAAQGDTRITAKELLTKYDIDVIPLTAWSRLRARARHVLQRNVELLEYDDSFDVRAAGGTSFVGDWSAQQPLFAWSGESGVGKSWLLYSTGLAATDGAAIVVLIRATGNAREDLQLAADKFWNEIKGNGGSGPITTLASKLSEMPGNIAGHWLTILIDDVQSQEEADQLAASPIEDWGIRLAITGSPEAISVFQKTGRTRVAVVEVDSFSPPERDEYLQRRLGEHWADVPYDLRDTLRRPLLAGIYCNEVATSSDWQPIHEYDLFDRSWKRLSEGRHEPGPYDGLHVANLAATILKDVSYPWSAGAVRDARIDEHAIGRIRRAGWLRRAAPDGYEVPHDRLLNYAVARSLCNDYLENRIDESALTKVIEQIYSLGRKYSGRVLGYVPMDLLHLLLKSGARGEATCTRLVAGLDVIPGIDRDTLYSKMLPTLGGRIAPVLSARLEATTANDDPFFHRPIIDGLTSLPADDVRAEAVKLLSSDEPHLKIAAIRILAKHPDGALVDRLWLLHCNMQDEPRRYGEEHFASLLYKQSMRALRSCSSMEPTWVERAICRAQPQDKYTHDLAYLLAGLPDGASVWHRCKSQLLALIPPDKHRAIIGNISRYLDREEVPLLEVLVGRREDFIGPAALGALAKLDPDRAVEHLVSVPASLLAFTNSWYLPKLLVVRRDQTNRQLLEYMRKTSDPWQIAYAYSGFEDWLDILTLDFLLDSLLISLRNHKDNPLLYEQHRLVRPLNLLAAVSKPGLLNRFHIRKGTDLEKELADFLLLKGPRLGVNVDSPEREPALSILLKIGGDRYVSVTNNYLDRGDRYGHLDAIRYCHRDFDATTTESLMRLALQAELWDGSPLVQQQAAKALAVLGETAVLIKAVMALGLQIPAALDDFVTAARPFDDVSMRPAIELLQDATVPVAQKIGAVTALGVGRRHDHISLILDLYEDAPAESALALACTIALSRLQGGEMRAVRLLKRQLESGKYVYNAHVALLSIGTEPALLAAIDYLKRNFEERMAINLARIDLTRGAALEMIAENLRSESPRWFPDPFDLALNYLKIEQVRELVRDEGIRQQIADAAFAGEGSFWVTGSKARAIRALGTVDQNGAFQAAIKALRDPDAHDRTRYPYRMVALDAARAVSLLMQHAVTEKDVAVLHAIARALSFTDLTEQISTLLDSTAAAERATGCLICAFNRSGRAWRARLQQLLEDPIEDVVKAAISALIQLEDLDCTDQLVSEIVDVAQSRGRKWTLLEALVTVADMGDDGGPKPSWLERIDDSLSPDMWEYATEEMKKRREKRQKGLKRSDD